MMVCEQFSQRSTCPPSAAVRQRSIADITFNWSRLTWPALAATPRRSVVAEYIRDLQLSGETLTAGRLRRRLHFLAVLLSFLGSLLLRLATAGRGGFRCRRSCRWRHVVIARCRVQFVVTQKQLGSY